jgi:hypothetical protein
MPGLTAVPRDSHAVFERDYQALADAVKSARITAEYGL